MEEDYQENNQGQYSSDYNTNDENNETYAASSGLVKAAKICKVFMWIGIVVAAIGCLLFIFNIGDAMDGYSKDMARCGIGISCIIYGVIEALSTFILTKVLNGLSVMTMASEYYLSK